MTQSPFPDLTLPPATILMNLLNTVNARTLPRPLTADDCVFGDPAPYGGDGANTQIPFGTTDPATFGAGTVLVRYTRIDIGKVMSAQQPALTGSPSQKSDLLAALNEAYDLNLQAEDIVDGSIDTTATPVVVSINCAPNSLIYCGAALLSFGEAAETPPALSTAIAQTTLDGLTGPSA